MNNFCVCPHLSEIPFQCAKAAQRPSRNQQHGRESHQPAQRVCPVWVHIPAIVFQRLIVNQKINETYLEKHTGERGKLLLVENKGYEWQHMFMGVCSKPQQNMIRAD